MGAPITENVRVHPGFAFNEILGINEDKFLTPPLDSSLETKSKLKAFR
jgi:hypothetical protein